jgi:hypothetical protein
MNYYLRLVFYDPSNGEIISIEDELRPAALAVYENITSPSALVLSSECKSQAACPVAIAHT